VHVHHHYTYIHTHTHRNDDIHENTHTKNQKKEEKIHSLAAAVGARAPSLRIQEVEGAGRGLVVTSTDGLCAGQAVLVDTPLAAVLHR
jgi:hypothetical protein